MSNANLHRAKKRKNDEFYTRYEDVEKELAHYPDAFRGKVVYCNCDDYRWSAFPKYFKVNFHRLGLKRLVATCFNGEAGEGETPDLFAEPTGRTAWHWEFDGKTETVEKLNGNGAFQSRECVKLLKECDIVCTNPPFSIAKELVRICIRETCDFILLSHIGACIKIDVFPYIKQGKIRVAKITLATFDTPEGDGQAVPISWLTTLPDDRPPPPFLELTEKYDPARFPKYDNYDAINVNRLAEIPCDYSEAIGVPITFLTKYNPGQFEIIGISKAYDKDGSQAQLFDHSFKARRRDNVHLNGEMHYDRIFIRRKNS